MRNAPTTETERKQLNAILKQIKKQQQKLDTLLSKNKKLDDAFYRSNNSSSKILRAISVLETDMRNEGIKIEK